MIHGTTLRQDTPRPRLGEPSWTRDGHADDATDRPETRGKFLWTRGEKLYVKGVTYGTFRPDEHGEEFHDVDKTARDFSLMAGHGINAVRTYTVPPRWLLDLAGERGLRVLVGVPWEQHVTFLDDRARARSIVRRIGEGVRGVAGHPALLAYAIGNEIPAPIVRWHGRARVERFLERLYWTAQDADPGALTTYVNFPSTEYLELPFLDLYAFNVYLERREQLEPYLARIQNIAGDRPLLLAEIGLDSRRNGLDGQAESLDWQVRSAFAAAAAGTFVYSWTDEWHRGGADIEDWDFGLTDRERRPKPALDTVRRAYAEAPFPERHWPPVSVVVCTRNGARTIRETCEHLLRLDYPDVQVIVVDDGSTDATASIVREFDFELISTENRGLASARNTGLAAARGEYVAYLDDDAWPDPQWLKHLVQAFEAGDHAAVGGPNVPPRDEGGVARCVARSPGGPVHVLFDDARAEHVPGCNLAVRRSAVTELGGFDPLFRVAGDDVDLCWQILDHGLSIGFAPGAMVSHRRRSSVSGYLKQQTGYGRAEALLERKWPEKYNTAGHPTWTGRIYGPGGPAVRPRRWRVYYGSWGTGLFQRLYTPTPGIVGSLPLTPEWWLVLGMLALLSSLSVLWTPFLAATGLLAVALGLTVAVAVASAHRSWVGERRSRRELLLTCVLTLIQPLARLIGRSAYGLRPWWREGKGRLAVPVPRRIAIWSEEWESAVARLDSFERLVRAGGPAPIRGGDFDRWDIELRGGLLGGARVAHTIEEHGSGRQLVRFRVTPRLSVPVLATLVVLAACTALTVRGGAWIAAALLGVATAGLLLASLREMAGATGLALRAARAAQEPGLEDDLLERIRDRPAGDLVGSDHGQGPGAAPTTEVQRSEPGRDHPAA